MQLPPPIKNLIESFEKLPGIGPKSAARLAFYLLHVPQKELDDFSSAIKNLKLETVTCTTCLNVSQNDPCTVCQDSTRDQAMVCVVEQPLDILAVERTGKYKGVYHVLHGAISPLNNIGPDEIHIEELLSRIRKNTIKEVILATSLTMEGEATAMYLSKAIRQIDEAGVKISRIAHGLPVGADLEYADELTLEKAMMGRTLY